MEHKPKTPLFAALQNAFHLALASKNKNSPPADELIEMQRLHHLSRRKFLTDTSKTALAFAAGSLLLNSCRKDNALKLPINNADLFQKNNQPKIVVIGAGIAGLNCSYQLKKQNIHSTIFEGSERSGGRIFTQSDVLAPGLTTEFGGEFIDSTHKDMLTLAAELDLTLLDTFDASLDDLNSENYFFDNRRYTRKDIVNEFANFAQRIQDDIDSLPARITYDHHPGNAVMFDNMSLSQYLDGIGMTGWLRKIVEMVYVTEFGLDASEQTCLNMLLFISTGVKKSGFDFWHGSNERYKIAGGNQQATTKLANILKTQIEYDQKLVSVTELKSGKFKLAFINSAGTATDVTADIVVFTIPFSTLRDVELQVTLPDWKTNAINNLGYGTNSKLLLGFTNRQWALNGFEGGSFTDESYQSGWDNSILQAGTNGGYTMFLGGTPGVNLANSTPMFQAKNRLPGLEKVFPGTLANFNNNVQRMQWPSYQWTKGSYSCYTTGQITTINGAQKPAVGNLYFAGEHCSEVFQGYMNGGALTGRQAAEAIAAKFAFNNKNKISEFA